MNAPGKSMIKVVSILMLIFSSISLIVLFVSLIGSAYIAAYHLGVGVILIFALIISFASVIFEFIAAILGLKHCGRPEKANSLFGIGVTLIPQMAVDMETRQSTVSVFRLAEPRPSRTIGMVWRKTSPLETHFRTVAGVVLDCAGQIMAGAP